MQDKNHPCSICRSVAAIQGCLCDDEVVLLCSKCFSDHFADLGKDHNRIELDLALRMQADPSLINLYLEERVDLFKLLNDLRENLKKSKEVKQQYSDCKQKFIDHIEAIYNELYREADEFARDTTENIKIINNYKVSLSREGKALIEKYRDEGIEGILKNTIESKDILTDEIVKYMADTMDMKVSNREDSSFLTEKVRSIDNIKREIAEEDKGYNPLRDTVKNHPAQTDSCIKKLCSNTDLSHQTFHEFTYIEDPELEMNDIKQSKGASKFDIQSEEPKFNAKRKNHEQESQISELDEQIESLKSDLKLRNAEHMNRISVKERQIIALEFCFRVAIYLLFAFALGIEVATTYLLTVIICLWILWDKFICYIIKLRVSRGKTIIDLNKQKVESLFKIEDDERINLNRKLGELMSDLEIIYAEAKDLAFLKYRQIVEVALHYGLAILITVCFKFSMNQLRFYVFIFTIVIVKIWYILNDHSIQGKVSIRETNIHSIKEELESLLTIEDTDFNNLAIKLGQLQIEMKIRDAEHENHISLRNVQILVLQWIFSTATFLIFLYGLSKNWYIAIFHIILIINWFAVHDNISLAIVMYWKELREIINDKLSF
jgi:hypothetical protein